METDGPEVRLGITNCGTTLMEVALEPWGEDYWLRPDESVTIVVAGRSGDAETDTPFDINYYPDAMAVYCNGGNAWVVDGDGNKLESGYQRPEPSPPAGRVVGPGVDPGTPPL